MLKVDRAGVIRIFYLIAVKVICRAMNLYHQELIDHYRYPRHRGTLASSDFSSESHNPSCGDKTSWQVCVTQEVITHIAFEGSGCVISQGAASMLAELSLGKTLTAVSEFTKDTMLSLVGMELGPTRLRCALLPLEALQAGIVAYSKEKS